MRVYRFVGTNSVVGNIKMSRFGQRFNIDDKMAKEAQKGGCAIINESDFDRFGFTSEELKIWADPFIHPMDIPVDETDAKAKVEFQHKQEAVQQLYRDIRQGLLEPESKHVIEEQGDGALVTEPLIVEVSVPVMLSQEGEE